MSTEKTTARVDDEFEDYLESTYDPDDPYRADASHVSVLGDGVLDPEIVAAGVELGLVEADTGAVAA